MTAPQNSPLPTFQLRDTATIPPDELLPYSRALREHLDEASDALVAWFEAFAARDRASKGFKIKSQIWAILLREGRNSLTDEERAALLAQLPPLPPLPHCLVQPK